MRTSTLFATITFAAALIIDLPAPGGNQGDRDKAVM